MLPTNNLAQSLAPMDPDESASAQTNATYPTAMNCTVPIASFSGYAVSSNVPLTQRLYYVPVSQFQAEKPPLPSYRDIREELGNKLDHLSRKQKRKMIKNKRNKMRRSMAGSQTEEKDESASDELTDEEHKRHARLWEERNQMMEVNRADSPDS